MVLILVTALLPKLILSVSRPVAAYWKSVVVILLIFLGGYSKIIKIYCQKCLIQHFINCLLSV